MTIHPAHLGETRPAFGAVGALLVILVVATMLRLPAAASDLSHLLRLHMALETLSIVATALIVGLVWSVRHENPPANLLWLASAFLGVALLDFLHVLSLPGMPDFIAASPIATSTGFWLAARFVGALGLLAAVWMPWRVRPARALRAPGNCPFCCWSSGRRSCSFARRRGCRSSTRRARRRPRSWSAPNTASSS